MFCGQQDGPRCCKKAKTVPTCPQHGSAIGPTGPKLAPRMAAKAARQALFSVVSRVSGPQNFSARPRRPLLSPTMVKQGAEHSNLALRGANRAPRWSNKKPKIWQDVSANIKFQIYIGFFLYVCMYVRMHKSSKDNAGQVRGTSDANLSSSLPGV